MRADLEGHIARVDKNLSRRDGGRMEPRVYVPRFINLISARSKIKFENFISGEARGDIAKIYRRTPLKFLFARTPLKFSPRLCREILRAI